MICFHNASLEGPELFGHPKILALLRLCSNSIKNFQIPNLQCPTTLLQLQKDLELVKSKDKHRVSKGFNYELHFTNQRPFRNLLLESLFSSLVRIFEYQLNFHLRQNL